MGVESIPSQLSAAILQVCRQQIAFSRKLSVHGSVTVIADDQVIVALLSQRHGETSQAAANFSHAALEQATGTENIISNAVPGQQIVKGPLSSSTGGVVSQQASGYTPAAPVYRGQPAQQLVQNRDGGFSTVNRPTGGALYKRPLSTPTQRSSVTPYESRFRSRRAMTLPNKPYKCPHCWKSFWHGPSLARHTKLQHSGEKGKSARPQNASEKSPAVAQTIDLTKQMNEAMISGVRRQGAYQSAVSTGVTQSLYTASGSSSSSGASTQQSATGGTPKQPSIIGAPIKNYASATGVGSAQPFRSQAPQQGASVVPAHYQPSHIRNQQQTSQNNPTRQTTGIVSSQGNYPSVSVAGAMSYIQAGTQGSYSTPSQSRQQQQQHQQGTSWSAASQATSLPSGGPSSSGTVASDDDWLRYLPPKKPKPWKCDLCSKSFRHQPSLYRHRKNQHNQQSPRVAALQPSLQPPTQWAVSGAAKSTLSSPGLPSTFSPKPDSAIISLLQKPPKGLRPSAGESITISDEEEEEEEDHMVGIKEEKMEEEEEEEMQDFSVLTGFDFKELTGGVLGGLSDEEGDEKEEDEEEEQGEKELKRCKVEVSETPTIAANISTKLENLSPRVDLGIPIDFSAQSSQSSSTATSVSSPTKGGEKSANAETGMVSSTQELESMDFQIGSIGSAPLEDSSVGSPCLDSPYDTSQSSMSPVLPPVVDALTTSSVLKLYTCSICHQVFRDVDSLNQHKLSHIKTEK